MKQLWLVVGAALISTACGFDGSDPGEGSNKPPDKAEVGSLALSLTASDSRGRQYRLRDAEFSVSSYYYYPYPYGDAGAQFSTVVSTETDPDAPTITLRVVPGQYYVSLAGDWYIERLTANGPERVDQAVLLSDAFQYAYVDQSGVTFVAFRFGVDGELIDFRHGDLTIGVQIELPGESDYPDGGSPFPPDGSFVVDAGVRF